MTRDANQNSDMHRFLALSASGVAGVSGLFVLITLVLTVATHVWLQRIDPLNNALLVDMQARFANDSGNEQLKDDIRRLDLIVRKEFFEGQAQVNSGGMLLAVGVAVFIAALGLLIQLRRKAPLPGPRGEPDAVNARARLFTMTGGVILLLLGAAAVFLSNARKVRELESGGMVVDQRVPYELPSREEIFRNWPAFRGPHANGRAADRDPPLYWSGPENKGILWKVKVPRKGHSSPVIWGARIFLTGGDDEMREVYCFSAETGALLWTVPEKAALTALRAPEEAGEEAGWAAPSCATDGNVVVATFGTGNVVAMSMEGKPLWAKHIGIPDNHYGHSSSLIIYDKIVLVQFDDRKDPRLLALDVQTGELLWEEVRDTISWSSPIIIEHEGKAQVVLTDSESVAAYSVESGEELWREDCMSGEMGPSAAYANGIVFACNDNAVAVGIKLTTGEDGTVGAEILWVWEEDLPDTASPVATDKYVYLAHSSGYMTCLDVKDGKEAWIKEFPDGFYGSPVLVNDRIYALDLDGVMQIFSTGESFKSLGESPLGEACQTTPAFINDRIYIRGEMHLYCIVGTK